MQKLVRLFANGRSIAPWSSEHATGNRRPGDAADACIGAVRDHLSFFFAVDEVVVVLHGDELVPVVLVGDVLEGLEFPGCHLGLKGMREYIDN